MPISLRNIIVEMKGFEPPEFFRTLDLQSSPLPITVYISNKKAVLLRYDLRTPTPEVDVINQFHYRTIKNPDL